MDTSYMTKTLNRVNHLIENNQKNDAFDQLYKIVNNRRIIRQWNEIFEEMMKQFITLCVDLKKGSDARVALTNYRNLCQTTHTKSLDDIIGLYISLSEKKLKESEEESNTKKTEMEGDSEEDTTENLLMSYVSNENFEDRTDHEIMLPRFKTLWEAYKTVLELLKNNRLLEQRYHSTARQALKFCAKLQKKTEFKKISDTLRNNFVQLQRSALYFKEHKTYMIDILNPVHLRKTLSYYLETRLVQLDIAMDLNLWQESFKSLEDVYSVISRLSHVEEKTLIRYFKKSIELFRLSHNLDFTVVSFAIYRLLKLNNETFLYCLLNSSKQDDENVKQYNQWFALYVIFTFMSSSSDFQFDTLKHEAFGHSTLYESAKRERQLQIFRLLGVKKLPSKEFLLEDIRKTLSSNKRVESCLSEPLKKFIELFVVNKDVIYDPSKYITTLDSIFQSFNKDIKLNEREQKQLKYSIISNLVDQLSQYYETVSISHIFEKYLPKAHFTESDLFYCLTWKQRSENLTKHTRSSSTSILNTIPFNKMYKIKINHLDNRIVFTYNYNQVGSNVIGNNLVKVLNNVVSEDANKTEVKKTKVQITAEDLEKENESLNKRMEYVSLKIKVEEYEASLHEQKMRDARKQIEKEEQERDRKRKIEIENERRRIMEQKNREEEERQKAKKLAEELLKKQSNISFADIIKSGKDKEIKNTDQVIENMKEILKKKEQKIQRELREKDRKLKELVKHYDYLEMSKREKEITKFEKLHEEQIKQDKIEHERIEEELRIAHENKNKLNEEEEKSLKRMFEFKDKYIKEVVMPPKIKAYEKKKKEQEERRKKAFEVWKIKREKIIQEIQKRRSEEEERERKRIEREERERREKEEKERIAQLQLEKQIEAEKRARERLQREMREKELENQKQFQEMREKEEKEAEARKAQNRWGSMASSPTEPKPFRQRFSDSKPKDTFKPGSGRFGNRFGSDKNSSAEDKPFFNKKHGDETEEKQSYRKRTFGDESEEKPYFKKRTFGDESEEKTSYRKNFGGDKKEFRPMRKKEEVSDDGFQTVQKKTKGGRFSGLG